MTSAVSIHEPDFDVEDLSDQVVFGVEMRAERASGV
jgi:hypothetical protein